MQCCCNFYEVIISIVPVRGFEAVRHSFLSILLKVIAVAVLAVTPSLSCATTIHAILSSDQPRYREAHRSFIKAIASQGYKAPATNIVLHTPSSDPLSWADEFRHINGSGADLIIAYGAPASVAAVRSAADGIPVVSADVFVSEQPTKGMCGVSSRVSMVTLINTLLLIRPIRKLGILHMSGEPGSQQQLEDVKKNMAKLGVTVNAGCVSSLTSLDSELNRLLDRCEAIVITEGSLFGQHFERIAAKAKNKRIPIISTIPDAAEKGALVSLEISPQEQGYLAAEMAVRVLEGAKTEFLSFVRPQRVDLVINVRQAKSMGIGVPFSVVRRANRLIN